MKLIVRTALAAAVFFAILAAAVWLLATSAWLRIEYDRAGLSTAGDPEAFTAAAKSTLYIVRPNIGREDLATLTRAGDPLYTEQEIDHLEDVKQLTSKLAIAGLVGGFLIAAAAARAWRSPARRRDVGIGVELGGWATLSGILGVALAAVVAWPIMFPLFHQVFFEPGTWSFEADSGLITLFPERFWFDSALAYSLLVSVGAIVAVLAGRAFRSTRVTT